MVGKIKMNLIKVNFNGVNSMILLDNHIKLIDMCGAYPTAKYLKRNNFSIQYALACLSHSKRGSKNV